MRTPLILIAALAIGIVGCDQQQPLAAKPAPEPGIKQGETPAVEPDAKTRTAQDADAPLPPATTPTTSGDPGSPPAAPLPPVPPPPTGSPTGSPSLIPSPADAGAKPETSVPSPSSALRAGTAGTIQPSDASHRDLSITSAVYRAVAAQPGISLDGSLITITTVEGLVTLRGQVGSDPERDHLAAVAGTVPGVRGVNNRLDVSGR